MANFEERIRVYVESGGTAGVDQLRAAFGDLSKASDKTRDEVEGMLTALGEAAETAAKVSAYQALESKLLDTATKAKSLREEVDRLGEEFVAAENPSRQLVRELERKSDALSKLEGQQRRYSEDLRRAGNVLKAAGVDTRKLAAEEKRLADTKAGLVQRLREEASAAKSADQAVTGLSGKIKGLIAAAAGYLGLRKLKDALLDIVGVGDRFEGLEIRMRQAFGSAEAGAEAMARIRDIAATVPDSFESVADSALRLKSFGLDPLDGTLRALIDQSAALGGSQETLNGIILATGQAWAKQKLQGEEILQLVERGVPVWDLLAKATGKSAQELQKLSEQGALGRDVMAALIAEMGKASEGAAASGVGRLSALWTKLKDEVAGFYDLIANSGPMEFFRSQLDGLLSRIRDMAADGSLKALADRIGSTIVAMGQAIGGAISFVARFSREILALGAAFVTAKIAQAVTSTVTALASFRISLAALSGPIGLVTGALTAIVVWFSRTKETAEASSPALLAMAESLRTLRQAKDEDREATVNAIRAQMDSLELTLQLTEAALEQAKAERDAHLERDRSLEVANRTAALEREREKQLQRNVENLEREAAAMRNTAEAARTALDAEDRRLAKAREAQAQLDEQAGGTRELIEAWKTLGLQGDITGQKLTEAGQKMLSALDMVIADARVKGDQLGAALTAGIGKVSTSGELRELQQRLDTLFEQGRIGAEQYARVTTELLTKQQALRDEAAKLAGTYRETGRTAEESLRAQIRQWEVLRGNAVATAEAIRQNLAKAMAEGADDGRIQQMQQQLQQTEVRAAALNNQIQNANQQLQQTGQQGQQQLQQVSQGFQQVGQAADQAGEQVGRFGRGGAVEELRKAIASVREEFEALGAEAAAFFDRTLLHAARGVNRMGDLFQALNEAASITRSAFEEQQQAVAAQADQLANLTDESIERMIAAGTTADGLRAKAKRLQEQFTLLGESDLGRLRSALDSAASKLDAITDKARQARDQLEDMNRQLQEEALREAGREEELAKLRRDRELARIRELAEASGEINSQTVRENMRLIEERYRRELELIREREREEKRANRDVDRERSSSPGGGSGGRGELTPARREPDRVVRIQIPDVGDVDVVGDDSAAVLERGLQEVARAARAGRRFG